MEQHHEQNNICIFVGCYILMITNCVMENWVLQLFPTKSMVSYPLALKVIPLYINQHDNLNITPKA